MDYIGKNIGEGAESIAKKFGVNKLLAFEAIGSKKLVAGQEDLIMNIMFNLNNKKNNIKIV